jgi:hypothetical protein
VGQKTVRFSDLSGQLIIDDEAPARIVVAEHPGLPDGPVEIEALTAEATDIEKAGGQPLSTSTSPATSSPGAWCWTSRSSTGWPPTNR